MTTIPFDVIAMLTQENTNPGDLRTAKMLRVVRLSKMARVLRIGKITKAIQHSFELSASQARDVLPQLPA